MIARPSPVRHSLVRRLCRRLTIGLASDERGSTAAFVAVGMVMMLGMVALAVDVGMLVGSRTESQRAADGAALAGAASLISGPNDEIRAKAWAEEYAEMNTVHGEPVDLRPDEGSPPDVEVLLAEQKVRVRVRNIATRGNAIRTIFARILGWDEVNVGTVAAAQVSPAGAGTCPLPLALPDRWTEEDGDDIYIGLPDDHYEPYVPGTTVSQCGPGIPMGMGGCDFTGFYPGDINDLDEPLIEIKVQSGPPPDPLDPDYVASPCVEANSWRCWFQPTAVNGGPGGGGANDLRPWILGCPQTDVTIGIGDTIYAASGSGNMQSLVHQDFKDLVDTQPGVWNNVNADHPSGGCVTTDLLSSECLGDDHTLRIRFMPVVRPDSVAGSGSNLHSRVVGLACVFVDKVATEMSMGHGLLPPPGQWNVYVRLTDTCNGIAGGGGPILKALQLVE